MDSCLDLSPTQIIIYGWILLSLAGRALRAKKRRELERLAQEGSAQERPGGARPGQEREAPERSPEAQARIEAVLAQLMGMPPPARRPTEESYEDVYAEDAYAREGESREAPSEEEAYGEEVTVEESVAEEGLEGDIDFEAREREAALAAQREAQARWQREAQEREAKLRAELEQKLWREQRLRPSLPPPAAPSARRAPPHANATLVRDALLMQTILAPPVSLRRRRL